MTQAFIEYLDGDEIIKGNFEVIEQKPNFIKIKSKQNILILPYHRINKIKLKTQDIERRKLS